MDCWVVDMSKTSEMDAGGNGGVGVDMEGILPAHSVATASSW